MEMTGAVYLGLDCIKTIHQLISSVRFKLSATGKIAPVSCFPTEHNEMSLTISVMCSMIAEKLKLVHVSRVRTRYKQVLFPRWDQTSDVSTPGQRKTRLACSASS